MPNLNIPSTVATQLTSLVEVDISKDNKLYTILGDKNYYRLEDPGHKIVINTSYSIGYYNCCGVAIFGKGIGFSHYQSGEIPPEEYVPDLAQQMASPELKLTSIVLGGDSLHFSKIVSELEKQKIPIIGGFLDSWPDTDINTFKEPLYEKTLVVEPLTNDAYLLLHPHSHNGIFRFMKLTP